MIIGRQTASRKQLGLLLALLWLIPAGLAQQTINVPASQLTIQAGINAANKGDTVLVAPGVYHEYLDFQGKAITVTSSGGAAVTIIDSGSNSGTATVNFLDGELRTSVLSGFTIQGGGNANDINTVPFGGIYISNAAPSILNNIIVSNACSGVTVNQGAALIQGNTISGTLTVNSNCPYSGAGVLLTGNSTVKSVTSTTITGNIIQNNVHGLYAGGIVVEAAASPIIQNNTISNNTGASTGGIFLQTAASATIQGNTVSGNSGGCAGGISVDTAENLVVENNVLHGNSGGCVGGIAVKNTQYLSIVQNVLYGNSTVSGNTATAGGINILVPGSTVGPFIGVIAGNTMSGDTLSSYTAGESATELNLGGNLGRYLVVNNILVGTSSSIPTTNCSLANNKFSLTPLVFDHNDIYNGQGGANYGGACPDQSGTFGNISADPQFVNPAAGAYQLKAGSPAIDAGNNSAPSMPDLFGVNGFVGHTPPVLPTTDLGGSARPQDATGKGYPIVDMGAYEFAGTQDAKPAVLTLTPSAYDGSDPQLSLDRRDRACRRGQRQCHFIHGRRRHQQRRARPIPATGFGSDLADQRHHSRPARLYRNLPRVGILSSSRLGKTVCDGATVRPHADAYLFAKPFQPATERYLHYYAYFSGWRCPRPHRRTRRVSTTPKRSGSCTSDHHSDRHAHAKRGRSRDGQL